MHTGRMLLMLCSLIGISGCGSEPAPAPSTPAPSPAAPAQPPAVSGSPSAGSPSADTTAIREVPADSLPIGDTLPPLDEGRVEVPIPTGWSPLPRDAKYLTRFYKGDRNGLPRIEVLADDQFADIGTVTKENVRAFAEVVAKSLGDKKLVEPVLPLILGNVPCARYILKVELKLPQGSVVAERQTLVTVRSGRTYTIHLLVLPNKLLADRDAAYAVCAGLRFPAS